jgi:HK97 gp10 family phage protein
MGLTIKEDSVSRTFQIAPRKLEKVRQQISMTMARAVVKTVKQGIIHNEFQLAAKSPSWARRSLDKRPLINTREYLNGIKAVKVADGAAIEADLILWKWLEFGTKKMPARPHFRPAIRKLNEQLSVVVGEEFFNGLFGG